MKRLTRFALHLMFALRPVSPLLVASVVAPLGLCEAQEVDTPARSTGTGSVVAPSPWVMLITPLQSKVDLKLSGFYIAELDVPVAQVDLTIKPTSFLSITPSYMYYKAPASGLNKLAGYPGIFKDSYAENQFRIDGTLSTSIHDFELSARNMYVRRFRPDGADDLDRYRGRLMVAHPLAFAGSVWKPFASYEAYYEQHGGWSKDRYSAGVTLPLMPHVLFQPSYMYEKTDGTQDVHYLLFGLMIKTR